MLAFHNPSSKPEVTRNVNRVASKFKKYGPSEIKLHLRERTRDSLIVISFRKMSMNGAALAIHLYSTKREPPALLLKVLIKQHPEENI